MNWARRIFSYFTTSSLSTVCFKIFLIAKLEDMGYVCLEDAAVLSHTSFGTDKIFGFQLFFLVLSLLIFSLFTAAPNRPCGAYWSRSKLNTTQHQLVFSDRFLGCQLLFGPRNSFPETIKTCILHYIHFATLGHPRFSHLSTICYFSLKLFPKQDQMNIWGKDIQTVNLWLWNDMNSFPAGEYFRQNFQYYKILKRRIFQDKIKIFKTISGKIFQ